MKTTGNALLKINSNRARRMSEEDARGMISRLGFGVGRVLRRSASRDGLSETVVWEFDRTQANADGSPRYDRARLTVTFSI